MNYIVVVAAVAAAWNLQRPDFLVLLYSKAQREFSKIALVLVGEVKTFRNSQKKINRSMLVVGTK